MGSLGTLRVTMIDEASSVTNRQQRHASAGFVSDAVLTPLRFLERSADVWGDRVAVADGSNSWTYAEHYDRVRGAVGALTSEFGLRKGDRVALLLPNTLPMLELHYAVPGASGVLVPLNTRLTAADYAYVLHHSGARLLVADRRFEEQVGDALAQLGNRSPRILWSSDDDARDEYGTMLREAVPGTMRVPDDERSLLSINYTSGTTGKPKGVMTCHRGAFLHCLGVIAEAGLTARASYLWTLPMFHCNGWGYIWAVTAMGSRHICLKQIEPDQIWRMLIDRGVTHLCAAPTVVTMILESKTAAPCPEPVNLFIGGAPPSATLLERAGALNIAVTHLYGLTETYGPIAVCAWNPDWDDESVARQAELRARQGVGTVVSGGLRVVDAEGRDVPRDGKTAGELVVRGNNVMLAYYRDPEATARAFEGGWFHSGDLAVMHPDGYIELRDRLKDIVISGGENIATVEVEQALVKHPAVSEAAVVAQSDERWGEIPIAFVTARPNREIDAEEVRGFARQHLAGFKVPRDVRVLDELPKTGTGKVQKFLLRQMLAEAANAEKPAGSRI